MNNRFIIVVPFYNVEKWIKYNIASVKKQNYKNFICVLIDDISTDNTYEVAHKMTLNDNRFILVKNTEKKLALRNIYEGIEIANPNEEDIIITLDGDDWLSNQKVLSYLNDFYNRQKCWLTYGSYSEFPSGKKGKFAKQIPQHVIDTKSYREYEWCTSHLRTFKYHLWSKIKREDLLDSEGNFYKMTWDLSFMFPMLEMAGNKSRYIQDILYVYNLDNPLNDHKVDNSYQVKLEREIRNKNKYEQIPEYKLSVNFYDNNISHSTSYNDALEKYRVNRNIEYAKNIGKHNISIFTDRKLRDVVNSKSRYNVAWLMEPRAFLPEIYEYVDKEGGNFDLILTYDQNILDLYPNKAIFTPADGLFVDSETIFTPDIKKEKMVSMIYSNKRYLEGHRLRHELSKIFIDNHIDVDMFGSGTGKHIQLKSDGLKKYMFSIVIENNRDKNYFTEKILDCFACRTIPLYWGAPNIGEWFDMGSIFEFNDTDHLLEIINSLSEEKYFSCFKSLEKNYEYCKKYYDYDRIIYNNIKNTIK